MKIIGLDNDFGKINCTLKKVMKRNKISIYKLCKLTGYKYDVIKKYMCNDVTRYDTFVLARLCHVLECDISEIIRYIPSKK